MTNSFPDDRTRVRYKEAKKVFDNTKTDQLVKIVNDMAEEEILAISKGYNAIKKSLVGNAKRRKKRQDFIDGYKERMTLLQRIFFKLTFWR